MPEADASGAGPRSTGEPPFVDEHQIFVRAPAASVWRALGTRPARARRRAAAGALLAFLRPQPARTTGVPLEKGSTTPGFVVTESKPLEHVRLAGQHRFSTYVLEWTLMPAGAGTVVAARTYAAFVGLPGTVYHVLIIRSGAHRLVMKVWLRVVRHRAVHAATPPWLRRSGMR